MTLEDLLSAINNLDELEREDGTLGRNAVMKVCPSFSIHIYPFPDSMLQICKLGRRIFNSGPMQASLQRKCADVNIKEQGMICAVVTRWLTQGTVLQRALELRPALDLLCDDSDWTPNCKKGIAKFKLDNDQWLFLEQLEPMLIVHPRLPIFRLLLIMRQMLFLASEHMLKSKFLLIHQVIPLFDSLINKFEDFISNEDLFAGVRAAAIHGRAVICKYYSKTDDSIMYRMAMSKFHLAAGSFANDIPVLL